MKRLAVLMLAALLAAGCSGRRQNAASNSAVVFKVPQIPDLITDDTDRLEYLLNNWWSGWSAQMDSTGAEKAFSEWAALSSRVSPQLASSSIIKGIGRDSLRILRLAQRYLYDPNSPFRDEDIYGPLAAHCGGDLAIEARSCALNARGTVAADFIFEDARGRRHNLHGVQAPFTILFFSNPGCHACKDIITALQENGKISSAVESGDVAVVNIYIDEDLDAWRDYLPEYPAQWHTGFDPLFILREDSVYHIRAIPSVYLLDAQKRVMLKDATTERLIETLDTIL